GCGTSAIAGRAEFVLGTGESTDAVDRCAAGVCDPAIVVDGAGSDARGPAGRADRSEDLAGFLLPDSRAGGPKPRCTARGACGEVDGNGRALLCSAAISFISWCAK